MENKDHTIVLTGGGGILGRAMIEALSQENYKIAVIDVDSELAKSAASLAKKDMARAYTGDVTDKDFLFQLAEQVEKDLGPVTGLICNAATKSPNFFDAFEKFPLEDWDQVMAVNLTAPMLCSQVFGGKMVERGTGSIVNILSIYGIVAPDQRIYEGSLYEGRAINTPAVYSVSKAGLFGLTKYLASYWGDKGVRVNAVTPGGVFSGQNKTFVEKYNARTMMNRMAQPFEIADAVTFLLSQKASYITGQNIVVDGGLSAW